MADFVDDEEPFFAQRLVDDAVIALPELEQSGKVAFQRLWRGFVKVLRQPTDSVYNAAGYRRVNPFQLPAGGFKDAWSVHTTPV